MHNKTHYKDITAIERKAPGELSQVDLWRLSGNGLYRKAYCLACRRRGLVFDLCKELDRFSKVFNDG